MRRPSSIDRLPDEIKEMIGKLRRRGCTIDEILTHLQGMAPEEAPSRSALGRHIIKLDMLGEKMRRSRDIATALVDRFGDVPESQAARLNIELLHNAMLDLFLNAAEGDDEEMAATGKLALQGDPEGIMMFAKAVDHLAHASRLNQDYIAKAEARAEERGKKGAMAAVESVAKSRGISAETLAVIKAEIFGVKE
jgi:hypothetical protein